jgi:hypothetical protein
METDFGRGVGGVLDELRDEVVQEFVAIDGEVELDGGIFSNLGQRVEAALESAPKRVSGLTSARLISCDAIPLVNASNASGQAPASARPMIPEMTDPTV